MDRRETREFEAFVCASGDSLMRLALLATSDPDRAQDVYQEALQRLASRWSRVDNPRAFARRVIANLVVDGVRARARRPAEQMLLSSHDVADPRAAATQERIEVRGALLEALAVLTPTQRTVLALRYLDDVSEAEVAALLGVSVGTVKSTASRAIDRLETHPALLSLRTPTDNG